MTLTLLKSIGQVVRKMSLSLGLSAVCSWLDGDYELLGRRPHGEVPFSRHCMGVWGCHERSKPELQTTLTLLILLGWYPPVTLFLFPTLLPASHETQTTLRRKGIILYSGVRGIRALVDVCENHRSINEYFRVADLRLYKDPVSP